MNLADAYDEAVAKILDAGKRRTETVDGSISMRGLEETEQIFLQSDYAEGVAKIGRVAAAGGAKAQAVLSVQSSMGAETAQVLPGKLGRAEKEIEELFSTIKKEVEVVGKDLVDELQGSEKAVQTAQTAEGRASASLGTLLGGIGKEMKKAVSAPKTAKAGQPVKRLADLAVVDQIAELEKMAMGFYDKEIGGEELDRVRGEVQALAERIKSESLQEVSLFEMRLVELRNRRLGEVMTMLGVHT